MKWHTQYNALLDCIRASGRVLSDRPGGKKGQNPSHSFHLRLDADGNGGVDYVVTVTPERMENEEGRTEVGEDEYRA